MANISFEGREPVRLTWDSEGRLREAVALDSNKRRTFDDEVPRSSEMVSPARVDETTFTFLATRERSGPARNGYLISSPVVSTDGFRCLNICIHGERDRINPNSISSGMIECRAGVLLRPDPIAAPVTIAMKQTAHQNWAIVLFRKIAWELNQVVAGVTSATTQGWMEFVSGGECLLETGEKTRLAMLLYAEFWHRISASKEVKQTDLQALGLNVGSASTVATMFERMELKICDS